LREPVTGCNNNTHSRTKGLLQPFIVISVELNYFCRFMPIWQE
jgi:hypothetical protein